MIRTFKGRWESFNEFITENGEVLFVKPYLIVIDTLSQDFPFYAFVNIRDSDTIVSCTIITEEEYFNS